MKGTGMSILKQPYNPAYSETITFKEGFAISQQIYLILQSGKSKASPINITRDMAIAGASIGLAFIFWPLVFLAALVPILWVAFPRTRPINQSFMRVLIQRGTSHSVYHSPLINWKLFDSSDIYRAAVVEWFDALRVTHDATDKSRDWQTYLDSFAYLVQSQRSVGPDFEKLKIMQELMKGEK